MVDPKLGPRQGTTCLVTQSLDCVNRSTADHVANLIRSFTREILERWYERTAVLTLLAARRERFLRSLDLGASVGVRHVFAVQRIRRSPARRRLTRTSNGNRTGAASGAAPS